MNQQNDVNTSLSQLINEAFANSAFPPARHFAQWQEGDAAAVISVLSMAVMVMSECFGRMNPDFEDMPEVEQNELYRIALNAIEEHLLHADLDPTAPMLGAGLRGSMDDAVPEPTGEWRLMKRIFDRIAENALNAARGLN